MPLEIKIGFTTGSDTTVRVFNSQNNQMFLFTFNRQPNSIVFDPNNQIIIKDASLTQIAPVPVELTSFTSSVDGKVVTLKWSTATEINNKEFIVERSAYNSESGLKKWTERGKITGRGTQASPNNYLFMDAVESYGKYIYRLKQIDLDGTSEYSQELLVEAGEIPSDFSLEPNYPNPFNPSTTIRFTLPAATKIHLAVYNLLGEQVALIDDQYLEPGVYERYFSAENVSSGTYLYVLRTSEHSAAGKMNVLK